MNHVVRFWDIASYTGGDPHGCFVGLLHLRLTWATKPTMNKDATTLQATTILTVLVAPDFD